jgi:hypothetical protein
MSDIIRNAMRTPDGTIIESRHRHDYVTHTDKNSKEYMIDGGLDYVRSSANGDEEYLTVTLSDSHEVVRENLTWGTCGINGDQPLSYKKLCDMDTAHIEACLDTQTRMYPQLRTAMRTELVQRGPKKFISKRNT